MSDVLQFSSEEELSTYLQNAWIDVSAYWKWETKDVSDLFSEVDSWETQLSFDKTLWKIIREVRVLGIEIIYWDKVLYEEKQVFKDDEGNETRRERVRDHLQVAVSEKMSPEENPVNGFRRAMKEELGIILWANQVKEEPDVEKSNLRESLSFPQIWTIYHIFTIWVELTEEQYNPEWYIEQQEKKNTYFKWKNK